MWWNQKQTELQKKQTVGQIGELWAQGEYKKQGYGIIAQNEFNTRGKQVGEIDFIAKNALELVFVEVKTRTVGLQKFGSGADSINQFKQRKLLKAVQLFLSRHPELKNLQPRIDVCLVEVSNIDKQEYSVIIITNAVEDWN